MILDEWLSAGDIAFREKATARMQEFVKQAGILVLATHSHRLLLDNCDRVIWLDNGKIVKDGTVDEVWGAYSESQKALKIDARNDVPIGLGG